jgi:hypothetical protein
VLEGLASCADRPSSASMAQLNSTNVDRPARTTGSPATPLPSVRLAVAETGHQISSPGSRTGYERHTTPPTRLRAPEKTAGSTSSLEGLQCQCAQGRWSSETSGWECAADLVERRRPSRRRDLLPTPTARAVAGDHRKGGGSHAGHGFPGGPVPRTTSGRGRGGYKACSATVASLRSSLTPRR